MNGSTFAILKILLLVGGIVGGAWALDARMDTKITTSLEYIKLQLADIKADVKELMRNSK